jgi:uncharacterized membrane protein YoaK (UPF0700 family)
MPSQPWQRPVRDEFGKPMANTNPPSPAPPAPPALIAALLGLTFVTGIIDAVSLLSLGHVFVANMTGNVVFLGFALAHQGDVHVTMVATALLAFVLGALAGGEFGAPARFQRGFGLEFGFLMLASALASALPATAAASYLLVATLAFAMGIRNALVRKLAIPDMTTTVLTMVITGLAADSTLVGGHNQRWERRALAVLALLGGALIGALLLAHATRLVIPLAAVIEFLSVGVLLKELAASRRA